MKSCSSAFYHAIIYIFLFIILVFTLFPLIYAFFGSFKGNVEFLAGGANILPKQWDFGNYVYAWREARFARYTMNSLITSVSTMMFTVVIASLAGYVFARSRIKYFNLLLVAIGLTMFIPNVVLIYPIFQICIKFNLIGTLWSIIITQTAASLSFSVILINSYMRGINREIDEAARVDGCSFFRTYFHIIIPLSKPILATTALLAFKSTWNSYLVPLALTLAKPDIRPLTVGVIALKNTGEGITSWNVMTAGSVLAVVPMIIVYLLMNKYFISGITAGSIKG